MVRLVTAACIAAVAATVVSAQSTTPPGGLSVDQVPQFVVIGFDDNPDPAGMQWILDFLSNKKNSDGSDARVSFYCNGTYVNDCGAQFKAAFDDGHEIANHTQNHYHGGVATTANPDGKDFSVAEWAQEMNACTDALVGCGIPSSEITGFRTPFLERNANTIAGVKQAGLAYDCSVEDGWGESTVPWPYEIETGVWELPNAPVTTVGGTQITGFDYNLWVNTNIGGKAFTGSEFLSALKNSLDKRLADNRAPFMFGAHTQYYVDEYSQYTPNASTSDRRAAIENFLDYALSKPEVRVVSAADIIAWCKNPVPLEGSDTGTVDTTGAGAELLDVVTWTGLKAGLSGVDATVTSGNNTVHASLTVPQDASYASYAILSAGLDTTLTTATSITVTYSASKAFVMELGEDNLTEEECPTFVLLPASSVPVTKTFVISSDFKRYTDWGTNKTVALDRSLVSGITFSPIAPTDDISAGGVSGTIDISSLKIAGYAGNVTMVISRKAYRPQGLSALLNGHHLSLTYPVGRPAHLEILACDGSRLLARELVGQNGRAEVSLDRIARGAFVCRLSSGATVLTTTIVH